MDNKVPVMPKASRNMIAGKTQSGFTLLETLVTLTLIGLLCNLAAPAFQSLLERERLIAAAETLYGYLHFTRQEALRSQRPTRLIFKVMTNGDWCYGLSQTACDCRQPGSCQIQSRERVIRQSEFPGIRISGNSIPWGNGAIFDPVQDHVTAGGATLTSTHFQIRVKTSGQGRIRICNDHNLQTQADLDYYPICN